MWTIIDELIKIYGKQNIYLSGLFILHIISYWIISFIFYYIDKKKFFQKYKIQNNTKNNKNIKNVIKQVIFNQLVSIFIAILFYKLYEFNNFPTSYNEIPSNITIIYHFIIFLLIEEIGFYYTHRLCHYSYFYKYIHKKHHEWITPISMSSIYCHPLEHIFVNMIPLFTGPLIMNSHLLLIWLWIFIATVNTLYSHCGYHFPLTFSNEVHDFHHLYFNECFGILGILDKFHNTNKNYINSKQYKRDKIYLLNENYPSIN